MKKTLQTILFLLIVNFGYTQTLIQMPSGVGMPYAQSFIQNAATPLYSYNGFLYCKAYNTTDNNWNLFKVNEGTNTVTQITGSTLSYDFYLRDFQVYNNEIFCRTDNGLLRINPQTNNYSLILGTGSADFAVHNNRVYFLNGYYDLNTGLTSSILNPENPTLILQNLYGFKIFNNSIICSRTIIDGPSGNAYESKIYKITDSNQIQLLNTNLLNGFYTGLEYNKPVIFNNKYVNVFNYIDNNTTTNTVQSFDLNSNTLNTIYGLEPANYSNNYFLLNNNIYFNNTIDQTFVSNGINVASLTSLPNIINSGGGNFSYNIDNPTFGGSGNSPTVLIGNTIFGCKSYFDPNSNSNIYEIRKTDGTLSGTFLIYSGLLPYSAITVNNDLYFFKSTSIGLGELIKYNNSNQTISSVLSIDITSYLFPVNNSIFVFAAINGVRGLYKLDLSTLSNQEFNISKTTFSPNPTQSQITFSQELKNLDIFDITGKKIKTFENTNTVFDVANLEKGIYLLKGKTIEGSEFNEKLIKE